MRLVSTIHMDYRQTHTIWKQERVQCAYKKSLSIFTQKGLPFLSTDPLQVFVFWRFSCPVLLEFLHQLSYALSLESHLISSRPNNNSSLYHQHGLKYIRCTCLQLLTFLMWFSTFMIPHFGQYMDHIAEFGILGRILTYRLNLTLERSFFFFLTDLGT